MSNGPRLLERIMVRQLGVGWSGKLRRWRRGGVGTVHFAGTSMG